MSDKSSPKKKLLVVDDEPNIRLLIKRIFEEEFTIFEAENGEKALEVALRQVPDVILMDIMMPESDGLSALNEMKSHTQTSNIPVIMLTGVGHELNERLAKSVGANGYMRKPIKPQELIDAVRKVA
ncbi:MAG: response regulator [Dehalococcoidales bacterium]|nr:response regulator [Dehalococcoidales bacterium]